MAEASLAVQPRVRDIHGLPARRRGCRDRQGMNPKWSPAAIRSDIMTTATTLNNDHAPMTTDYGSPATSYDYGAGQVHPTGVLDPGLVYEAGEDEYLHFLCNYSYNYNVSTIRLIASTLPAGSAARPTPARTSTTAANVVQEAAALDVLQCRDPQQGSRRASRAGHRGEALLLRLARRPSQARAAASPRALARLARWPPRANAVALTRACTRSYTQTCLRVGLRTQKG